MFRSGRAHDDFSLEQLAFVAVLRERHQLLIGPDFDGSIHDKAKRVKSGGGGKAGVATMPSGYFHQSCESGLTRDDSGRKAPHTVGSQSDRAIQSVGPTEAEATNLFHFASTASSAWAIAGFLWRRRDVNLSI